MRLVLPCGFLMSAAALLCIASCKGPETARPSSEPAVAVVKEPEARPAAETGGKPGSGLPTVMIAPPKVTAWHDNRMLTAEEASDYTGDASCARCHDAVCRQYKGTRHAETLLPVTPERHGAFFRNGNKVKDGILGFTYRADIQNGKPVIVGETAARKSALPADFAFGSGRNAITFLSRERPDAWVDLRISYYTREKKWDYTPTQRPGDREFTRAAGIVQAGELLTACLQCHVTYLRAGAEGPDIEKSHLGIGCERCHGPGRAHIEAIDLRAKGYRIASIFMEKLKEASPERINKVCGDCHHDTTNSPPGEFKTENGLARFEGVALPRSKCYQKSGTLSCVTCHNPHQDADPDPARNDALCLNCHSSPKKAPAHPPVGVPPAAPPAVTVCKVNPKSGCVGCHMPAQTIATIPHAKYHHHWIKVWEKPGSGNANAALPANDVLKRYLKNGKRFG